MIDTHVLKKRELYLKKIIAFQDTEPVKVVTGIRRCGKSSLLKLMTLHLKENGVSEEQILEMNFETAVNYELNLSRIADKAKLNYSKLDLTKGFTKQLKAEGGVITSCSSSKPGVATVNNSGKVSAKSIGKTTIKVKLSNGQILSCTVSVKPNKYQAKKITVKDVVYNTSEMKAYAASFDKK